MPREVREVRRFAWHLDICDIMCGIRSPTLRPRLQNGLRWRNLFQDHHNQFLTTPSQRKPFGTILIYFRSLLQSTLMFLKVTSRTIRIGRLWSPFVLGYERGFGLGRIQGKRVTLRPTTNLEMVLLTSPRPSSSGVSSVPRALRIVSHHRLDENSCQECTACQYTQFRNPIPRIFAWSQTKALADTLSTA